MTLLLALALGCPGPVETDPEDTGEPPVEDTDSDTGSDTDTGDTDTGCEVLTWYEDLDGDGVGTEVSTESCEAPDGSWATETGDCDDADPQRYPGAYEACDAQDDRDCDGEVKAESPCVLPEGASHTFDYAKYAFLTSTTGGDFDGDGRIDFIAGDPHGETCGVINGSVMIQRASQLPPPGDHTLWRTSTRIGGVYHSSCFGWTTGSLGDLNGDGVDDFFVGEPNYNPVETYWMGMIHVYTGIDLEPGGQVDRSASEVILRGGKNNHRMLGAAVSSLGDLDGDGLQDLVEGYLSGGVQVVTGNSLYWAMRLSDIDDIRDLFVTPGSDTSAAQLHTWHIGGGDVDGDGRGDLLVHAETEDRAWLFLAPPLDGSTLTTDDADASIDADATLTSLRAGIVPDRDDDGFDEIGLATPDDSTLALLRWDTLQAAGNTLDASEADLRVHNDPGTLGIHPDMDGDDLGDLTLARDADNAILFLPSALLSGDGTLTPSDEHIRWQADRPVSPTHHYGDMDGDGLADLLLRAETLLYLVPSGQ